MNNPDSSSGMILGAVENKMKENTNNNNNGGGFSPHIKHHKKAIQ